MTAAVRHLDLIAEMSQDFALSGDIEDTLRHGLATVADTVGAEAASLFLVDDATGELVCSACVGPVDTTGLRLPAGSGIVGATVAENRALVVRDAAAHPRFAKAVDGATGFVTRTILCAPMSVRDRRIGAIELLNKRAGGPFVAGDRRMLEALAASAALALHNARLMAAMVEQERVRRELELAASIQRSMLPAEGGDGPAWGVNVPARIVSGDFYDILTLADGRVAFCIGDVSGKSFNAALLMAKTASLFRCLCKSIRQPGRLLAAINAELCETRAAGGVFITMAAGLYDPRDRVVRLANAGHEPALLARADGGWDRFPAEAPPLGIAPDLVAEPVPEARFVLDGALYLFTDGVSEHERLGPGGVLELLSEVAGLPPRRRLAAILDRLAARDGRGLRDDLTLLLLEDAAR